jgi:hypothetical protein
VTTGDRSYTLDMIDILGSSVATSRCKASSTDAHTGLLLVLGTLLSRCCNRNDSLISSPFTLYLIYIYISIGGLACLALAWLGVDYDYDYDYDYETLNK